MSILASPSHSRPVSPHSPCLSARSDTSKRTSSIPRLLRAASVNQHIGRASEGGSGGRKLGERPCFHDTSAANQSRKHGVSPESGLSPTRTARSIHAPRTKVRHYSPRLTDSGSSSCNEAPGYPSDLDQHAVTRSPQAHQSPRQLPFRASNPVSQTPGERIQVPLVSPVSPVSLSSPFSHSSTFRPPRRPLSGRRTPTSITPQTSLSSFDCSSADFRDETPIPGLSTPSPYPQSRKVAENSLTPSKRPPSSFLIRQGLVPARGPPTLAMSMQIHAPSPIISARPLAAPTNTRRPSRSYSRPSSPLSSPTHLPNSRPAMTRPPSRSERMLRDTLRKVEEHERMIALSSLPSPSIFGATQPAHGFVLPPPPSGRRSRRPTSSSTGTDASLDAFAYCDTGACFSDEDEEDEYDEMGGAKWLMRSSSRSSSSSGHGNGQSSQFQPRAQPPLARHFSDDQPAWRIPSYGGEQPDSGVYVSTTSPPRVPMQRSSRSHQGVSRSSAPQPHASMQAVSRSSIDGDKQLQAPHDAVLRSRLEGVLKGANQQADRRRSRERGCGQDSGSSNSIASSRNLSMEGDWYFAPGEQAIVSSPTSTGMESPANSRSRANTTSRHGRSFSAAPNQPLRSPRTSNAQLPPHMKMSTHVGPLTPPPTPPFNARTAAEQCKQVNGYVSFANVEGLGVPGGEDDYDDDDDDAKSRGRWLKWFNLGQAKATGRDRSDSATSSQ